MCGHTRDRLYIPSFIEIRSGVSEPRGVKIWPFQLLWLVAFTTACTTVQAVIGRFDRCEFDTQNPPLTQFGHQNPTGAIFMT